MTMRVQTKILCNLDESLFYDHQSGPRYRMGSDIIVDLVQKLIPMLQEYGIDLKKYPSISKAGYLEYVGRDKDGNRLSLYFSPENVDKDNYREDKNDIYVKVSYDGESDSGVIQLDKDDNVKEAFSLITMLLENLGYFKNNKSEEPIEVDEELEKLIQYSNKLHESGGIEDVNSKK